MAILLEGPDATGKSTLALELQRTLDYLIIPSEGPIRDREDMADRLDRYAALYGRYDGKVIFDRHPAVSEPIYATHVHEHPPCISVAEIRRCMGMFTTVIYCHPAIRLAHEVKEHDSSEFLEKLVKQRHSIARAYEAWGVKNAHLIYRAGETHRPSFIRLVTASENYWREV
jgi:hypothetical protein